MNVVWQALSELSEAPEVITQKPAFVVFMEGGDKEEQVLLLRQGLFVSIVGWEYWGVGVVPVPCMVLRYGVCIDLCIKIRNYIFRRDWWVDFFLA